MFLTKTRQPGKIIHFIFQALIKKIKIKIKTCIRFLKGIKYNQFFPLEQEVLRVKRELLQLQQEELKRQRNNLAYREQEQLKLAEQLQEQWKSLQDVAHSSANNIQQFKNQPPVNYRSSMPNLQLQDVQRRRPPPPPIPPAKPLRLIEQRQRDVTIR